MVKLFSCWLRRPGCVARSRRGQAMVEYVVVAGILMATFLVLTLFVDTFRDYGTRILDMVAADYP
ncbi:MAG: hypothetical protein ABR497_03995 [Kiritimatiellia bacterium]|nr:hypothetical protein [Lentisphaerota bacterium]